MSLAIMGTQNPKVVSKSSRRCSECKYDLLIHVVAEFEKIALQLEDIQSEKARVEKMKILKWLSSYDFSASHSFATRSREPGTGLWILRSLKYQGWKNLEHGLLWLYGKCR